MAIKSIVTLLAFVLALVVFAPKEELYFYLEKKLHQDYHITIDEKEIKSTPFGVTIYEAKVHVKGVEVAQISKVEFRFFLVSNRLHIEEIWPSETLQSYFPTKIDTITALHQAHKPLHIDLKAKGEFGVAVGEILLDARKGRVDIVEPNQIAHIQKWLQKDQKGWHYAFTF